MANDNENDTNTGTPATKRDWAPFCKELAKKLLAFKNDRKKLLEKVKKIYEIANMDIPTLQNTPLGKKGKPKPFEKVEDIDPFTVFGFFCRKTPNSAPTEDRKARAKIVSAMANEEVFNIPNGLVPENVEDDMDFEDMPKLVAFQACFCISPQLKQPRHIDMLWELFEAALEYSKAPEKSERFVKAFDAVESEKDGVPTVRAKKITTGLSWIAPETFMNLSGDNLLPYIEKAGLKGVPENVKQLLGKKKNFSGEEYFEILNGLKSCLETNGLKDFLELNSKAYDANKSGGSQSKKKKTQKEKDKPENEAQQKKEEPKKENETPTDRKKSYGIGEFLKEVFISTENYELLKSLLETKKNIILQGPPGVGKTFAARRLAWSILGKKDDSKIEFVQFHQNYSYEDFVMGYKPRSKEEKEAGEEGEFVLRPGVFYDFCKKIKDDNENAEKNGEKKKKYFFIIDEINRGNVSKIFGELLMLLESDHRKDEVKLAYKKEELFFLPENLYVIGMMNTADRSLAMLDYALRRRFGFFEMKPAFDSDAFKDYCCKKLGEGIRDSSKKIETLIGKLNEKINDQKTKDAEREKLQEKLKKAEEELKKAEAEEDDKVSGELRKLINAIKKLNKKIAKDKSLGEGFRIGHSYFCWVKIEEKDWKDLTDKEKKDLKDYIDKKMRDAVWCDILPLLKEYYFDKREAYTECLSILKPTGLLPKEEADKLGTPKEKESDKGGEGNTGDNTNDDKNGGSDDNGESKPKSDKPEADSNEGEDELDI